MENDEIEDKYLESEELNEFLNAVREYGLDLDLERFYLLAFSGMRSSELAPKTTMKRFTNMSQIN